MADSKKILDITFDEKIDLGLLYGTHDKHMKLIEDQLEVIIRTRGEMIQIEGEELAVDDANRIDAFNQITGFYKSQRQGNLKIIITARDYALPIVESYCFGFSPVKYTLKKFSDEQITDIIKAEHFNISNW